jgi:hypothetical protein
MHKEHPGFIRARKAPVAMFQEKKRRNTLKIAFAANVSQIVKSFFQD